MNRWMYLDFNSYFASVEQQLNPYLRGKPIAVIPVESEATCAIAASYEAKAFGVKTGTPVWEAKKMCPKLICVVANHQKYVEFHEKALEEIERHIPIEKVCSIDEVACYLMDNESKNVAQLAANIKRGLQKNVGECLLCSIGIAPNRYLAKVASDMQKPNGLTFLNQEDLPAKLYALKLRDLPGIGANMELRLKKQSIFDLKKLCSLDLSQMRKAWGSVEGERMWYHLRGIDLPDRETQRRSVGHSHVLAPELRDPDKAREVGRRLMAKAASRLRRMGLVASKISLSLRFEDEGHVEQSAPCDRVSDSLTLLSLFHEMWEYMLPKTRIKKVSVALLDLEAQACGQLEFFQDKGREKKEKISQALDLINQKYGRDSVSFGTPPTHTKTFSGTKIAFTRIPDKEEFSE